MRSPFYLIILCFLWCSGCNVAEMQQELKKMQKEVEDLTAILKKSTSCDLVSIPKYNVSNGIVTVQCNLVGCEFVGDIKTEALRLVTILKENKIDFCKIDYFHLVFTNKGESTAFSFKNCELVEK